MNNPIDVVIPWVDGNDSIWQKEMIKYKEEAKYPEASTASYRFQSWDNLHYIFRGIETFMPWVNKVFLITCGQVPSFLDLNCNKLVLVSHEDYIPKEYLPTFNTNTIEMNLHRIKELSENFILFNDDLFPINSVQEEYYFKDNRVCDQAIQTVVVPTSYSVSMYQCQNLNNVRIINRHFDKNKVISNNRDKWFDVSYGEEAITRNKNLEYWNNFTGFRTHHMAQAYKKSMFANIWEKEFENLNTSSKNKFRNYSDVTEYVVRYWQLCEGDFYPRKARGKRFLIKEADIDEICDFIETQNDIIVSLEDEKCDIAEFDVVKQQINKSLEKILPNRSVFEISQ